MKMFFCDILLDYLPVVLILLVCLVLPFIATYVLSYCIYYGSIWRYLACAYIFFIYYDYHRVYFRGRDWYWLRNCYLARGFRSFFKMTSVSEHTYPMNKNYIVGLHPHGLLCFALLRFLDDRGDDYRRIFGFAERRFCTAQYNLFVPGTREFFIGIGAINATEKAMKKWLDVPCGRVVELAVGGAQEVLLMEEGKHRILLSRRKGFIRVALRTGAYLIPAYTFGETSLWDAFLPPPGSFYTYIQRGFKFFGVGFPILKSYGLCRRMPLTTVHGPAIPIEQNDNPTPEQVDEIHKKYCIAIKQLFDKYKHIYADKDAELIIE